MTDRIIDVIEPLVTELGFDLEAAEVRGSGPKRVLRVAIDSDNGVGIDDLADVTRVLSPALDASDVMGEQSWTLEVTSRGVDRPLTHPRHWRRNADRLVTVELSDGERFDGRIMSSDEEGVDLLIRGSATRFPYSEIVSAVVQIELNRKDA